MRWRIRRPAERSHRWQGTFWIPLALSILCGVISDPRPTSRPQTNTLLVTIGVVMVLALVASAIRPADYGVWAFEILPGSLATAALILTFRRFRFSDLAYMLVCSQFLLLATGAHYTYSEVPLFDWLQTKFELSRNHFDRLGHFAQGFVPAIVVREALLRLGGLHRDRLLFILVVSVCLAFSASYEILEMLVVILFYPDSGPEWLGMQGDAFDAQWDMVMATIGAVLAQLLLARWHDRSMAQVLARRPHQR